MSQTKSRKPISSHEAVSNLIKYSDSNQNLLQKYDIDFFLRYFDRETIQQLQQKMSKKIYNQLQFIRELTAFILHGRDQTLFLVIGLQRIYQRIVAENNRGQSITVKEFTHFLCNAISDHPCQLSLHSKEIPLEPKRANPRKIRDIDINAATVIACPLKQSPKISKSLKKKETRVDSSKPIHIFQINKGKKEIITLGRLASHISVFNLQLNKKRDIASNSFRLYHRNGAIMSMAFSQKQQRIGCIINHAGLVFWDYEDDFATEKLIHNSMGDRIHFLQLLEEWITTSHNEVYLWDLKLQKIKCSFGQPKAIAINDIEQINHLRCIAVSYTMKDQCKWIYIYSNDGFKIGSRMKLDYVGAHKIHYHRSTQTILVLGNNELLIFLIDQFSLDLSLLAELQGHQSIITSVTDLQDRYVITGDDHGTLRIWDLNTFRCQQVLKVANSLTMMSCLDNNLVFADSRLNVIKLEQLKQKVPLEEQFGVSKFYFFDGGVAEVYIFTNISCRIYNLVDGRVKRVIQLCSSQQEIIAVEQLNNDFIISTSKALLLCYTKEFKLKWKMNAHQFKEQIMHIRVDQTNRFVTTVSKEGNVHVWSDQTLMQEGPRKSIINFDKKYNGEVTVFDLSQKYSILVTGEKSSHLKIWDYQSCKLCHIIELAGPPCTLKVATNIPLLAVGCLNQKIYLYQLERKENIFTITFLQYGNLRYPQLKLNSLLSIESTTQLTVTPRQRAAEAKRVVSQGIIFLKKGNTSLMAVCYGRGNVLAYDISELQSQRFSSNKSFRRAVNIQRPVKEYLDKQISNKQYLITEKVTDEMLSFNNKLKVSWNRKVHSDIITHLDTCQSNYFSTVSLDGSFKIAAIDTGEVLAVLALRNPLPNIWKVQFTQQQQICKQVHYALTIMNSIINDKQTSEEEKNLFDISSFMKQICTKIAHSSLKKKRKSVRLLKDQFGTTENKVCGYQSLKSMQAFRRVSLIRQNVAKVGDCDFTDLRHNNSTLKDKSEMMNLLSPYHFAYRLPPKWFQQQQERFDKLLVKAKSVQITPRQSLELNQKSKQKESKVHILENVKRRPSKHNVGRSLSQQLQKITKGRPSHPQRHSEASMELIEKLTSKQPIKNIAKFLQTLNQKIPKEFKIKKYLKKQSGFIPKF